MSREHDLDQRAAPAAARSSPIEHYDREAIQVHEYDPEAPAVARRVIELIAVACPGAAAEHVGSSAVSGLAGKGIVDLLLPTPAQDVAEVAEALDTTTAAVNSALQRARAQLAELAPVEDELAEPGDAGRRQLLDRYAAAFERADQAALLQLLTDDVVVEMPPYLTWLDGRDAFARFLLARRSAVPDPWRMLPTRANGQPALAAYLRGDDGAHHAHSIQVFTVTRSGVSRLVAFLDPALFATFGLPPTVAARPRR